ncbi:adenosine deaminase 2-like [Condylostylus longicornis]|uniref:adenosine deaminase 2-like n=1 Tax=Condylostylus longicornis TaxID=2530218 RepID=UPI00244E03E5|nr:adenosine deaminase 2-like [Condylostylus longicornis]
MGNKINTGSYIFLIIYLLINLLINQLVIGHPRSYTSTPITITRYSENTNNNINNDNNNDNNENNNDNSTTILKITNIDDYFKQREEFLNNESLRYLGNDLILNDNEIKLNEIIMKLKEKEFNDGFKNPYEFKASRHFFEVVNNITNSTLFHIIEKMPKGAVLHAHDTAMASIDYVINNILNNNNYSDILWYCDNTTTTTILDGINIEDDKKIDEDDIETTTTATPEIVTDTVTDTVTETVTSISDIKHIRFLFSKEKPKKLDNFNDWKLLNDIKKNYDPKIFNDFLYKHFTLFTDNPATDYKDINDVWQKFMNIFLTLDGIVLYEPVWEDYFYTSLLEFYNDNVQYIEFRGLLPKLYDLDGNEHDQMNTLEIYNKTLERFKLDYPDFSGAKFIFAPYRRVDNETFNNYMESVKKFKEKFPNFIAGFDLVAQEDLGNPLKDYIQSLLDLQQSNLDIDFFFHAGETNWNGMDTDENLIDAILLGTKRIGHGYAILKHPKVMEEIKKRDIAIEINAISNQVLKLVNDNRNHPASHLFSDNYPVVVSSDDPSFWNAKPLSHDFYIAFMGLSSAHSDLRFLKKLAINSLKYSTLKDMDLYSAETMWEARWNHYVDEMIKEYSEEL